MDLSDAVIGVVGTVVATLVAAFSARATSRASAAGAVKTAAVTSLADLEKEAGQRAAGIYEGAITRLEKERAEDRQEIADQAQEIASLQRTNTAQATQIADLQRGLSECRTLCDRLRTNPPDLDE